MIIRLTNNKNGDVIELNTEELSGAEYYTEEWYKACKADGDGSYFLFVTKNEDKMYMLSVVDWDIEFVK